MTPGPTRRQITEVAIEVCLVPPKQKQAMFEWLQPCNHESNRPLIDINNSMVKITQRNQAMFESNNYMVKSNNVMVDSNRARVNG